MAEVKLKIVGVITHNNRGGAQKAMAKLQTYICSDNVSMQVVYLYGAKGNDAMNNGKILVDSDAGLIGKYLLSPVRLYKYIKSYQPDSVISFLPYSNLVTALVARNSKINTRIISHRNPVWTYNPVLRILDKLFGSLGFYTAIVSNSLAVKDSFKNYPQNYKKLGYIINNGVEQITIKETESNIKQRYGLPEDKSIIVAIGRLSNQKRYSLALDIIANLDQVHFVIAGHGELQQSLEQQANQLGISNRVHFLGLLDHSNVLSLLKISDIYLQTSHFEGQSNALLEAISLGCCVVSSDINSQREVLASVDLALAGVLIDSNDPKMWSTKIKELLSDTDLRKKLSENAIKRSKDFTLTKMADEFLKLAKSEK